MAQAYRDTHNGAALVYADSAYSAGGAAPGGSNAINYQLVSRLGTPKANLTGLNWALFAQTNISLLGAPIVKGSGETTDADGLLSIPVLAATVPIGIYMLALSNANNTLTLLTPVSVS